jgi:aerobic carbon-monoxide dehydrogenase medium subunit
MKMPKFDYAAPASLDEAIRILANNEGSKVLSGGQSLLPILAFRLNYPSLLVDLKNIPGLSEIKIDEDGLRIGSRVRWCQIEADDRLPKSNPLLVSMISHVAHYQIRNRGTVGGSLAHGDPAAELPGFAVTSDCVLSVVGSAGAREIKAADFYTGALENVLEPDEIITSLFVPKWPAERRWGFQEFSQRKGDFAIAGSAVFYDLNSRGEVEGAHVGLIGVADTPIRLGAAEDLMNGRRLTGDLVATIRDRARDAVGPIAETQIRSDYRRSLVGTLLSRVLLDTMGQ